MLTDGDFLGNVVTFGCGVVAISKVIGGDDVSRRSGKIVKIATGAASGQRQIDTSRHRTVPVIEGDGARRIDAVDIGGKV